MSLTPLTPPPAAPSRSDPPEDFITRADAFLAWWANVFVPQFNALLPQIVDAGAAANYGATSVTSLTIGTGAKVLAVATGKAFQVGQFVIIAQTAAPQNYMAGQVTAYNRDTGALTVNVTVTGGAGMINAWTIGLSPVAAMYAALTGATFTGAVQAPSLFVGPNFYLTELSGNPIIVARENDYIAYLSAQDIWRVVVGDSVVCEFGAFGSRLAAGKSAFLGDDDAYATVSGGNFILSGAVGDYLAFLRSLNLWRFHVGGTVLFDLGASGAALDVPLTIQGDPVVTRTAYETLQHKTLTSPWLSTPTIDAAPVPTVDGNAPLYAARAWVNFDGTGGASIRGSGNVSSVTDNGVPSTGYTINFITAMPDTNYAVTGSVGTSSYDPATLTIIDRIANRTTASALINTNFSTSTNNGSADYPSVSVAFYR